MSWVVMGELSDVSQLNYTEFDNMQQFLCQSTISENF